MSATPPRVALLLEQCWHRVPGGTGVAAVELARALAARDDVDVVGLAARHAGPPSLALPDGVPLVQHALPRTVLYESWVRLGRPRVYLACGAPDLVHATGGAVPASGAPLVATVHDLAWRHRPGHFTARGRRMFDAWLDAARRAGRVLCPSAATADDLCAAGFSADRIRVVPLGADQTLADPGVAAALRDRYRLEGPVVLWLGVVEPRKDLGTLVSALQQVPEATLVVAGPSGWGVDLPAVVGPLGERVRIVGRVDEAEKRAWYALADVFAYPSLLEGFGLPVLEAMVQGTPIVASSGTATEEVVGPDAVVVGPGDVDAWAAAIHRLLDDPDEARRLGATGRTRAAAHTWEACAAATVDCYREVLQA